MTGETKFDEAFTLPDFFASASVIGHLALNFESTVAAQPLKTEVTARQVNRLGEAVPHTSSELVTQTRRGMPHTSSELVTQTRRGSASH